MKVSGPGSRFSESVELLKLWSRSGIKPSVFVRPLHLAAQRGLKKAVQELLSRGASVQMVDENGRMKVQLHGSSPLCFTAACSLLQITLTAEASREASSCCGGLMCVCEFSFSLQGEQTPPDWPPSDTVEHLDLN